MSIYFKGLISKGNEKSNEKSWEIKIQCLTDKRKTDIIPMQFEAAHAGVMEWQT